MTANPPNLRVVNERQQDTDTLETQQPAQVDASQFLGEAMKQASASGVAPAFHFHNYSSNSPSGGGNDDLPARVYALEVQMGDVKSRLDRLRSDLVGWKDETKASIRTWCLGFIGIVVAGIIAIIITLAHNGPSPAP